MSLPRLLEPTRTALIIWDMQKGIGARAHNVSTLRPAIASVLEAARQAGVFVVWSTHVAPPLEQTSAAGLRALMRRQNVTDVRHLRAFMQPGTPEVELIDGLDPAPGEPIMEKSTGSFFIGTHLDLRLRAREILTLVLTGVATELGIEFTARHAIALGYSTVVVEDAVGSFSQEAHERGLASLRHLTDLMSSHAVIEAWRAS